MAKAGLIVPLAIVGTLALGVGALYFTLLDRTPCSYTPEEISNDGLLKRQLVRSLSKAKEEKKIEYSLDQDCLNQILSNASQDIKKGLGENASYIGSIYVQIDGDNYKFYVEAKLPILQSRVLLDTSLTSDADSYYFNLNDVKAGSLPVDWALNTFGVLKALPLESAFKDMGLSMTVDHDNHRIIYKKENMQTDLMKMMSNDADDLLQGALDTIPLEFSFEKGIHASGDLSGLIDNSKYADSSLESEHYANYDASLSIIDNGIKSLQSLLREGDEQASLKWAQEYLTQNLQNLTNKGQEPNEIVKNRLEEVDPSEYAAPHYDKKVAYFTESELNNILATTGILGKAYLFNYKDEVAYVVIDRFFADIFVDDVSGDSFLNFTIGVNINGLETRATLETVCNPKQNSFVTEFKINKVYFGNSVAPENFAEVCKNMFSDALDSMKDRTWIEHERGSASMVLNFDKLLAQDTDLGDYNTLFDTIGGTRRFEIAGSTLTSNGEFSLWYQK